jgi:hypothetical protein
VDFDFMRAGEWAAAAEEGRFTRLPLAPPMTATTTTRHGRTHGHLTPTEAAHYAREYSAAEYVLHAHARVALSNVYTDVDATRAGRWTTGRSCHAAPGPEHQEVKSSGSVYGGGKGRRRRRGSFTRLPLESRADDCDTTPTPTDAAGGHGHLTPTEAAHHARERPPMCTPTSCPTVPPSNPALRRRSRCVAARKLDALALSGPATQRTPKHLHGLRAHCAGDIVCTASPARDSTCGLREEPKEEKGNKARTLYSSWLHTHTPALTRFVSGCSYGARGPLLKALYV